MRVCLLSYEFPPSGGGEASYVYGLAKGLGRLGHEVTVLAPHEEKVSTREEPFRVIQVRHGSPPVRMAGFLREAERKIAELALRGSIDIVHVTFDYPTFVVRLQGGPPCVATVHHLHMVEAASMSQFEKSWARKAVQGLKARILTGLEGRLIRQCAAIIAVSDFTRESLRECLSIPDESITVVKNGIDASEFEGGDPQRFRREFPQAGENVALFVGRLERSKGLDYLIPAFARASAQVTDATLAIVGGGGEEYVGRLKDLAGREGVESKVFFTGRIPQDLLPDAYAASSLVVLPSLMEGFGISLLESMAAGRPCVATRVGAIPELLADGKSGLLVNPADSRALAEALTRILSDRDLAHALGNKGLEVVNRQYTLERMARETAEVYRRALEVASSKKR